MRTLELLRSKCEESAECRRNLQRAGDAHNASLTALKAFYAEHCGQNGTIVLDEFLAATTEHANLQFDNAHHEVYSETPLLPESNRRNQAQAAEWTAAKIPAAQTRLDAAQTALDALTGARVN